jgi:hypothetical protein
MHECFLTMTAWNQQHVELGCFVDRRVSQQLQTGKIPNRVLVLPDGDEMRTRASASNGPVKSH